MARTLIRLLSLLLAFSLAACGGDDAAMDGDGGAEDGDAAEQADGDGPGEDGDSEEVADGDELPWTDGDETEADAVDGDEEEPPGDDYPDGTETPNRQGEIEYLIVTTQDMAPAFDVLAAWKTRKGVPVLVKTVEEIYNEYEGVDAAEQVRNYIIGLYAEQPLKRLLLGGDTPSVPHREFWNEVSIAGYFYTDGVRKGNYNESRI